MKYKARGFSLVEVILAVAIFGLFATALLGLVVNSYGSAFQSEQRSIAVLYAQEGMEAALSIRRQAWNLLANGVYGLDDANSYWEFSGAEDSLEDGKYTRTITVADACRDTGGNLVECPGDRIDLLTKKITVRVDYTAITSITNQVELSSYVTNWQSQDWTQTDWVGGSGQSIWSDITRYNSDDGKINESISGQVSLASLSGGDTCGTKIWSFDSAVEYALSDENEIGVSSGAAQLLLSAGPPIIGNILNSEFTSGSSPWNYFDWTTENTSNVANGNWLGLGGNSDGYVNILIPASKNIRSGGYWEQSFTTTVDNPTVTLSFDWAALQYQSGSSDFGYYVYVDSFPGNPIYSFDYTTEVSRQQGINSVVGWTSVTNIDVSSRVTTAGTYYLKIAGWVHIPSGPSRGPYQIGYDNVQLNWSGSGATGYSSAGPNVSPVASYDPVSISQWSSFEEVATKNGGEIYYQLSDNGGSTWQYWNGSSWVTTGSTCAAPSYSNCSTASEINSNIATFDAVNESILFRAFLASNGNQLVQLEEVSVSCAQEFDWDFSLPGEYNLSNGANIEVSGGLAQLVDQGGGSAYCTGTAIACNSLIDNPSCSAQGGCAWNSIPGSCSNLPGGSCTGLSTGQCNACSIASCTRQGRNCLGTLNCSLITSQSACGGAGCGSCQWTAGLNSCNGTASTCDTFGTQNVCQNQSGCSWFSTGGGYSTDSPYVTLINSYSASNVWQWTAFVETANKDNGEIYYQLSEDNGATWLYWNNGLEEWDMAGANDYNTATIVNTNIGEFPTTTDDISFRAFLSSNGSQLVQLDNIRVTWGQKVGGAGYEGSGALVSSVFNTTAASSFNILSWSQSIPACDPVCDIQFQLRTAPDAGGAPGVWSDWFGASGVDTYFTEETGSVIPANLNFNQWVQYRAELSGDGIGTPTLTNVNLNYTP